MTGFELGSAGIGSECAVNCATTTAPIINLNIKFVCVKIVL